MGNSTVSFIPYINQVSSICIKNLQIKRFISVFLNIAVERQCNVQCPLSVLYSRSRRHTDNEDNNEENLIVYLNIVNNKAKMVA